MRGEWKRAVVVCALLGAPAVHASSVVQPRLRLMAEERFDDDLQVGPMATGGQLMTKFSPQLGVNVKDERSEVDAFYAGDVLARHGSGKVTLDHRVGLEGQHWLSRRFKVDGAARVFRVTDPTSLPRAGLAWLDAPTFYAQARLGLMARLTQRMDLHAGYAFETTRVLEPGRLGGSSHAPNLELWYHATRRLSLGAQYRYQGFLYAGRDSQSHGAFAMLRYRLSRPMTLTLQGGPVEYVAPAGQQGGVLPRVQLELARHGERFDVGATVGHDLVGATGFVGAVWADYASMVVNHRFSAPLSAFVLGSYFRNGRAPDQFYGEWKNTVHVAQGYAVGAGVEYRLRRGLSMQGAFNRIEQVGVANAVEAGDLTRNVLAARLIYTAW
ncbi:hypothetical protein JGU66_24225 [Myxococcaceae bacterium JPH2]|nr:hypothetical protein [Myxococcaceae bacterium JPH2]